MKPKNRAMNADPESLAPLLDRSQTFALQGSARAIAPMKKLLPLYPDHPDVLHWFATTFMRFIEPGRWVDKTPGIEGGLAAPFLLRIFPKARFVTIDITGCKKCNFAFGLFARHRTLSQRA